ncbi:hypothetical protein TUM4438_36520 [Shewanella sairae]|uniref:Uncharacterized protein n=1 Tax=Shewanella sairae TaxID=190310 RepID=A0ABQ4PPH1_9GAMM|nr:hypothetical protein [Shewanella sairae]MCL1132103.1 hypothetical protein [Shewanella sairae]GIU50455.1 hypothetical protein TUM4438_36520 [Shewanella sairae]
MRNVINTSKGYSTLIYLLFLILVLALGYIPALYNDTLNSYICVLLLGSIFSSIELGSRYKDEPFDAISSMPGFFYILVNGFICCVGYYLIITFSLNVTVPDYLNETAQKASDILLASISSFLIMRSSFLTLGSENNQIDIGLSVIIKKLIFIVDRQVDRHQAAKRARNITEILKDVSLKQIKVQVIPFCVQVMQNVPKEEIDNLYKEVESLVISETSSEMKKEYEDTQKLQAGLLIYTLVGYKVLETAIKQLNMENKPTEETLIKPDITADSSEESPRNEYLSSFHEMIEDAKTSNKSGDEDKEQEKC